MIYYEYSCLKNILSKESYQFNQIEQNTAILIRIENIHNPARFAVIELERKHSSLCFS